MKISKEVIIGLVALVTILASIWGYKFLKGENVFSTDNIYKVQYPRVDQLSSSAPVLVNGFQVGTVTDIYIQQDTKNSIIVQFTVRGDINVPKTTKANIISTSIMGGKAIELNLNGVCSGDDCAESGSFLQGKMKGLIESMIDVEDINAYLESASSGVKQFIDTLDKTLQESETREGIGKTMKDLQITVENLKTTTTEINGLIANLNNSLPSLVRNLNGIADNLNEQGGTINRSLENIRSITEDLKNAELDKVVKNADNMIKSSASTIAALEKTSENLKELIEEVNSGSGSLGMLIKDKGLYKNLKQSTRNLDLLLQDIRLNPKRYIHISVFGKKDKEYTVPENDPALKNKDKEQEN